MSAKLSCFVVAPIGETGSEIRQDSDDLLDLIIRPALEVFDIDVIRGDYRNESGQIDVDVIKLVQESYLCIVDLSLENVNVYYELGRRDETGKPIILLKSSASQNLPVDIATRRYIEFNLDDRRAIISSRDKIKEAVQQFVDSGMEKTKGTSLFAISEKIDRIERVLTRLFQSGHGPSENSATGPEEWENVEPSTLLNYALKERNIPMAEYAMNKLSYSLEEFSFYDYVVEQVAALGSRKAGQMLIDFMETFMDSTSDTTKKIEYIGCLITFLFKTNQESKYLDIIEPICLNIKDEENEVPSQIYNQLNRIHYGIYLNEKDKSHLDSATYFIGKAIEIEPEEGAYYYNNATCYSAKAEASSDKQEKSQLLQIACDSIRKAIELDGNNLDEDHLSLACRLFHRANDSEWLDYMEALKKVAPIKEKLLRKELR